MDLIIAVVFWCASGTDYSDWNPHQLDTGIKFAKAHPGQCHSEQVEALQGISVENCKAQMMVRYMPGWKQKNPDKDYAGGDCMAYRNDREPLDMQALKERVGP